MKKILVIDNYDSFTYNLVQYFGELGADLHVHRNDEITLEEIQNGNYDGIVISPGPGHPKNERDFGVCRQVLEKLAPTKPILGVCLGHQGIGLHYGGEIVRAERIMHGKSSAIEHDGKGLFEGLPNPLEGGRYHSLILDPDTVPEELEISAKTAEGEIMGIRHRTYPLEGIQFHPESILTEHGKAMLANFMNRL